MVRVRIRVSVRVSLGFRDTARVRDLESRFGSVLESSISCILYGLLCLLGLGIGLELRFGSVLHSPPSYSLYGFLCPLGLGLV